MAVAIRRHKWCVWPFWGGKLDEADVLFNPNRTWDTATNPEPWRNGLNSTLVGIHELGHAFGLNHEDDVIATMNSFVPNGGPIGRDNDAVPHGDDVLGNRAGYGTSGSPREIYASMYERTGAGTSDDIDNGPFNVFQSTPTPFEFTIGNRGVVNETSVGVKFYLSTDRTITTGDILVGSAGYSLNSGVTLNRTVNITIPSSVARGWYFFGYIVDPENYIPEADEGNNSVAYTFRTFVEDQAPPRACFSVTPTSGNSPLTVTVNASCSSDPDGTIVNYSWDMGDGRIRSGSSFSYTYFDTGNFQIRLTVRDNDNLTDVESRSVYVYGGCAPIPVTDPDNPDKLVEPCLEPV